MGDVKFHDVETIILALAYDSDIVDYCFICASGLLFGSIVRVSDGLAPETVVV